MSRIIYRMIVPLVFPQGICLGEQADGNHLFMARDGLERPVLRGSALAGALRHACIQLLDMSRVDVEQWFGCALDGQDGKRSVISVPDCVLDPGEQADAVERTHNIINRHTGAVLDQGLFSLETLPPNTRTTVLLSLEVPQDEKELRDQAAGFLEELACLFRRGITLGGNAARGIGLATLRDSVLLESFDCSTIEQQAAWLDEQYIYRSKGTLPERGTPIAVESVELDNELQLEVVLGIAPGEDILVGDGQAVYNDYAMEPQRVMDADGCVRWRLPGATLRGAIRSWVTRLAARAGEPISDQTRSMQSAKMLKGDDMAWGEVQHDDARVKAIQKSLDGCEEYSAVAKTLSDEITCPIMRLFGSGFAKGRIHITDALSEICVQNDDEQMRSHVGVDRITGGSNEGFFFTNSVITGGGRFPLSITVFHPEEKEVRWLCSALKAIDVGIIRIGSSKAAGRLCLVEPPRAKGMFATQFDNYECEVK